MSSLNNKKITHSGERLKKARKSLGLSQGEFARRLGYLGYQSIRYLESGRKKFRPHIAKLIQCEFGINEQWLLDDEGDMLIEDVSERSVDVQKLVEGVVAESGQTYGKKLLPEEEKFAEIRAYVEVVEAAGPMAQALFNEKFIECFKSFGDWSKTKSRAKTINEVKSMEDK
jgi:transcriptional regulator with XRE-family HTH domain